MKRMISRFSGKCRKCSVRVIAGEPINYDRNGGRGRKVEHVDCSNPGQPGDSFLGFDPGNEAEKELVSYEIITSGGTFYQNRNGRCEDAPCCGCCTC